MHRNNVRVKETVTCQANRDRAGKNEGEPRSCVSSLGCDRYAGCNFERGPMGTGRHVDHRSQHTMGVQSKLHHKSRLDPSAYNNIFQTLLGGSNKHLISETQKFQPKRKKPTEPLSSWMTAGTPGFPWNPHSRLHKSKPVRLFLEITG